MARCVALRRSRRERRASSSALSFSFPNPGGRSVNCRTEPDQTAWCVTRHGSCSSCARALAPRVLIAECTMFLWVFCVCRRLRDYHCLGCDASNTVAQHGLSLPQLHSPEPFPPQYAPLTPPDMVPLPSSRALKDDLFGSLFASSSAPLMMGGPSSYMPSFGGATLAGMTPLQPIAVAHHHRALSTMHVSPVAAVGATSLACMCRPLRCRDVGDDGGQVAVAECASRGIGTVECVGVVLSHTQRR